MATTRQPPAARPATTRPAVGRAAWSGRRAAVAAAIGAAVIGLGGAIVWRLAHRTEQWSRRWDDQRAEFVETPAPLSWADGDQGRWIGYEDRYAWGRHVHRRLVYYDGAALFQARAIAVWAGPMAGDDPYYRHGHWTTEYPGPPPRREDTWYWYGQEIPAAEWAARGGGD